MLSSAVYKLCIGLKFFVTVVWKVKPSRGRLIESVPSFLTYDCMPRLGKTEVQHSRLGNDSYRNSIFKKESPCKFFNFTSAESSFASISLSGVSPSGVLTTVSEETLKKTHLPAKHNAIDKAFHLIEAKLVDKHGDIPQLYKQNNVNPLQIENSTQPLGLPD